MTVGEFLAWLDSHGEGQIEGCIDEEIEALRRAQGVSRLPAPYEQFLRACGREAGSFQHGTVALYPLVAEGKESMLETLEDAGNPFQLPERSFVFTDHQGYHFWYFDDVDAEPAAVWEWLEGQEPQPFFRTFEDWLAAEAAYHDFVWARRAARQRGEPVDTSVQFDHEPYRTLWG